MIRTKTLLTTFSMLAFLVACSDNKTASSNTESSTPSVAEAEVKVYRVSSEANYEPFIIRSAEGRQDGFEFELLSAIGEKQGLKFEFNPRPWEVLFSDITEGKADIISSGITITPERQAEIDFTNPHFETSTALLVGKNHPEIKSFADMQGKKIAVQTGTLQDTIAKKFGGEATSETGTWLSVKATMAGQTAATLGDWGAMSYYASKYPQENLRVIKNEQATVEQLGFGVRKGNEDLLNKLNQGLEQVKADGTYDKLRSKWFGELKS
ncbi:transporter substrate-binding domain-containing protein [Wielerella bovis]|uniref:substrate-binding periplasmic protein n=1 Tax=Wielerella bovis TaxID=2917790 RepID=UPI0020194963|nr:transporter substrate-binding domain-containing protein [Wielerella bovis]ULJ59427.1 transporter substrate-binding domain-containing protein [Wielerella bovis]ULJ68343.1 transporter substrate-binding domain-containing protein [Wielerella bovis]